MRPTPLLFGAALTSAAVAAAVVFDARPGINWSLWAILVAAGLLYLTREARPAKLREIAAPLGLAVLLSAGAAVTADHTLQRLIMMTGAALFAVSARVAAGAPVERVGVGFFAASPIIGALSTVGESWSRTSELMREGRVERALPVARGLLIATPIVIVLWALLAGADPNLDAWGSAIATAVRDLAFVPRLLFGIGIAVFTLGAYGLVLRGGARALEIPPLPSMSLAVTERLIVTGAVAGIFALFLGLQLPYLFGDPAGIAGSGITYSEWAHRGFAELSFAGVIVTLLIVFLERSALRGAEGLERLARAGAITLVVLNAAVLASAFRRIALYEDAYGYTSARLWAQAFMVGVGIALELLALEIRRGIDVRRFARRTLLTAAAMLVGLTYWNTDAFIVRRNGERFAEAGLLDVRYLALSLSDDALPALLEARRTLPAEQGAHLADCMAQREQVRTVQDQREDRWFEYSVRRAAASRALRDVAGDAKLCPEYNGKGR